MTEELSQETNYLTPPFPTCSVSSSKLAESDIKDRLKRSMGLALKPFIKMLDYRAELTFVEIDTSSTLPQHLKSDNNTYSIEEITIKNKYESFSDEEIINYIIMHDYILLMQPVKEYKISMKIKNIENAKPHIVELE